VGGWPPVVSPVIRHAKTLDYNPEAFPDDLHRRTETAIKILLDQAEKDSTKV